MRSVFGVGVRSVGCRHDHGLRERSIGCGGAECQGDHQVRGDPPINSLHPAANAIYSHVDFLPSACRGGIAAQLLAVAARCDAVALS